MGKSQTSRVLRLQDGRYTFAAPLSRIESALARNMMADVAAEERHTFGLRSELSYREASW
jgi:hypothetical protein